MPNINDYAIMPSVISADLCNLESDIAKMKEAGVKTLHIDVLDGNFSPSMPIGLDTYLQLSKRTNLNFDVHIMSTNNDLCVSKAIEMNAKRICFQVEGERHVSKYISQIKQAGIKAGLAFAPATAIENYVDILSELDFILIMRIEPGYAFASGGKLDFIRNKIIKARKLLDSIKPGIEICVDGRVSFDDIKTLLEDGANNLVGGSKSFFVSKDYKENYDKMVSEYCNK